MQPCQQTAACPRWPQLLPARPTPCQVVLVYGLHPVARWRLRRLPGPPFRWLVGQLPEMLGRGQEAAYAEWGRRYGGVFLIFQGGRPIVVLEDPGAARCGREGRWRGGGGFTLPLPCGVCPPRLDSPPVINTLMYPRLSMALPPRPCPLPRPPAPLQQGAQVQPQPPRLPHPRLGGGAPADLSGARSSPR